MVLMAMCSTLLLVGNEEAKTSVVLRFASDCYSPSVEGLIAASVVFCSLFAISFLHGPVYSLCHAMTTRLDFLPVACRGLVMPWATASWDVPFPNSCIKPWRMVVIVIEYV